MITCRPRMLPMRMSGTASVMVVLAAMAAASPALYDNKMYGRDQQHSNDVIIVTIILTITIIVMMTVVWRQIMETNTKKMSKKKKPARD